MSHRPARPTLSPVTIGAALIVGSALSGVASPAAAFGGGGFLTPCATFTSCTAELASGASASVRYSVTPNAGYVLPVAIASGITVRQDQAVERSASVAAAAVPDACLPTCATSIFSTSAIARAQTTFLTNRASATPRFGYAGLHEQTPMGRAEWHTSTFAEASSAWRDVLSFSANGHFSATVAIDGRSSADERPDWAFPGARPLIGEGDWFFDFRVWDVTNLSVSDEFELGGPTLVTRAYTGPLGFDERRSRFDTSLAIDFDFIAGTSYVLTTELRTNGRNGREIDLYNTARLQDVTLSHGVTLQALSGHDYGLAVSPVPEPSTWALLAAGLLTVSRVARRRRASA